MTKFDMVTHMGRGVFLEVSHCICTNASRGLSAIAEFLVTILSPTDSAVGRNDQDGRTDGHWTTAKTALTHSVAR